MNRTHLSYQASAKRMKPQVLTSRNSLGIIQTSSLWDKYRKQIIYIIKTNQEVTKEIDVVVEDHLMTLEVPLVSSYDKPFRTHKMGKENRNEVEDGLTIVGFSEFKLKPGYQYSLISGQVMGPNLIKIILGFSPEGVNWKN